ncbi:MAG: hypothetical protein K1Y01_07760 [Vicinamibacteria bacterium]|nr:hypothetical protein [Vicinamibacteria bacterium]
MAKQLAEAVLVLSVDDKQYKVALSQIPKQAEQAANSVKSISQAVNFGVFVKLGEIAKNSLETIGTAIGELLARGGEVRGIDSAFSNLSESIGLTKESMLATSREASKGLISDLDLMAAGNKALLLGLPVTADSFGTMAKAATTLGRAMGQDAKKSFDDLITALGRSSPMILDNLGLTVNVSKANEEYAKKLGKSAEQLTDAEKKTAFYGAAMDAAKKKTETIGEAQLTLAESVTRGRNALKNFGDGFSSALVGSRSLMAGVNGVGKALSASFGQSQQSLVGGLVGLIEGVAIAVVNAGQGVITIGHIFASVFAAAETIVNGVLTAVLGFAGGVVGTVDAMARLASSLPFASESTKQLAAMTSEAKTKLDAMTLSLAKSTAEAAKGVVGQSALHAKLDEFSGSLFRLAYNMENTRGSINSVTAATNKQGDAADGAAAKNQDMADKVAEAFRALNAEIEIGTKVGLEKRLAEIEAAKQKELESLKGLKFESDAQHAEMERLIVEKYAQRVAAATLAGDEIVNKEREVQQAIALSLTTGTENKLLQIQIARDKEIEALAFLKLSNEQRYAEDVAAVTEKYRIQAEAAQGYYATIELAAAASGFKTREELQAEADNAKRLYAEMLASGKFTHDELEKAHKKSTDAQMAVEETKGKFSIATLEGVASSAGSILRDLFGKNKAAAIAATAIDAAAAIVKAFAQGGILGFASAAAIAAATAKQIVTIKSTKPEGFAQGTPNLDFADFGAESFQPLHNQEAVIPRGGGHILAGEIAAAMPGNDEQLSLLRRLVDAAERAPAETRKAFRNAMLLDMA